MTDPEEPAGSQPDIDDEVEAVIPEFDGDPRAAIRALLHDLDALARGYGSGVSRGYVRHEVRSSRSSARRERPT